MSKIDRYIKNAPNIFPSQVNSIVHALFEAWAAGDNQIQIDIENTKEQIFVKNADGEFLDRLASSVGVSRPSEIGLLDEDFQQLIPNLSLKAKQVRQIFYDTMDVFWGPLFSRANITASNFEPFNISAGDRFVILVDGTLTQETVALSGDIAIPGSATSEEITAILNRLPNITASVIEDQISNTKTVNIRTNTAGPRGSLNIDESLSTMVSASKIDFNINEVIITDFNQRTVVYEIRHRELIIEIPAVVPTLRRTLKGSHHFHADSTLESAVAPNNGIWQGSFLFSPSGSAFTVTSNSTSLQEIIQKSDVLVKITVDDASNIPNEPGYLIFGFGKSDEEFPVPYISRPNNNTILLDPSYIFNTSHAINTKINYINDRMAFEPNANGSDLPIYLTSPVDARRIVQDLLKKLKAAGIVIVFKVLLPEYKYLCHNPFEISS